MFRPFDLFIVLRYLRAKRRNHFISFISLASVLGIIIGVMALITVLSVMNGFQNELRQRMLSMTAHVTISSFEGGLGDWRQVMATAAKRQHVIGAAPYVQNQAMLVNGGNMSGVLVRGVAPKEEKNVDNVANKMVVGGLNTLQPGHYGIVLGRYLAYALGVGVGDKVIVMTAQGNVTLAGFVPRYRRFTVTGIFASGVNEYDRNVALINLRDAQRLYGLHQAVTGVRLKLDNMFRAPKVSQKLEQVFGGGYDVRNWTESNVNLWRAINTEKTTMFVILSLIVAVAAFNVVSALVMTVTDKQADIAILRTLGTSPRGIMTIFVIQGALIGVVGTILGLVFGVLLANHVEDIVQALQHWLHMQILPHDVYAISDLPSDLHWSDAIRITVIAFALTLLSTIYPAWRAARTQPAEALRYE
jgi:lipoprotein-releasing system permease protein